MELQTLKGPRLVKTGKMDVIHHLYSFEVSENHTPTLLTPNESVSELRVTSQEVWVILRVDAHLNTKIRMPAGRWRTESKTPQVSKDS